MAILMLGRGYATAIYWTIDLAIIFDKTARSHVERGRPQIRMC